MGTFQLLFYISIYCKPTLKYHDSLDILVISKQDKLCFYNNTYTYISFFCFSLLFLRRFLFLLFSVDCLLLASPVSLTFHGAGTSVTLVDLVFSAFGLTFWTVKSPGILSSSMLFSCSSWMSDCDITTLLTDIFWRSNQRRTATGECGRIATTNRSE